MSLNRRRREETAISRSIPTIYFWHRDQQSLYLKLKSLKSSLLRSRPRFRHLLSRRWRRGIICMAFVDLEKTSTYADTKLVALKRRVVSSCGASTSVSKYLAAANGVLSRWGEARNLVSPISSSSIILRQYSPLGPVRLCRFCPFVTLILNQRKVKKQWMKGFVTPTLTLVFCDKLRDMAEWPNPLFLSPSNGLSWQRKRYVTQFRGIRHTTVGH